jgi:hypothetical protein
MKYITQNHVGLLMLFASAVSLMLAHFGLISHDHLMFLAVGSVLSGSQTRVIDPILTNVAQGYQNSELIGASLFPPVPVQVSGGQIIEFGREAFKLYNARRAPGGSTKRIQYGYLGKHFALLQDSLEGQVPREYLRDAARVPGIDLGSRAINMTMKALKLKLEWDQAQLALTSTNYDVNHTVALSGASKWSTSTGAPMTDIDTGREAIRSSVGIYPNTLVLSAKAFNACKNNPSVIARFQYNGSVNVDATQITPAMLAGLFNVDKVVIGKAITFDDNNVSTDIWGNNALLAYVPNAPSGMEEPSFGYTYTMEGNPMVEPTYFDNNTKSWIYPVNYERVPVLSGITSGYLIQTPA